MQERQGSDLLRRHTNGFLALDKLDRSDRVCVLPVNAENGKVAGGGDEQKLIVGAAPGRIHVFVVPLRAQDIDPDAGRREQGDIKIQKRSFGGGRTIASDDPSGATHT